jgi:DNA gyrase subunit A
VISEKGFGKRTALDDENGEPIYRITNRGGKGVKTIALTDKTGSLVGLHAVTDDEDLMLITKSGTAIRMAMDSIRVQGRATQGVKLIELQKRNDVLMFGCVVPKEEEETPVESQEPEADSQEPEMENTNE